MRTTSRRALRRRVTHTAQTPCAHAYNRICSGFAQVTVLCERRPRMTRAHPDKPLDFRAPTVSATSVSRSDFFARRRLVRRKNRTTSLLIVHDETEDCTVWWHVRSDSSRSYTGGRGGGETDRSGGSGLHSCEVLTVERLLSTCVRRRSAAHDRTGHSGLRGVLGKRLRAAPSGPELHHRHRQAISAGVRRGNVDLLAARRRQRERPGLVASHRRADRRMPSGGHGARGL